MAGTSRESPRKFELSCGQLLGLFLLLLRTSIAGLANAYGTCTLSSSDCSLLASLHLDGFITFSPSATLAASSDFGNLHHFPPAAVLFPGSTRDISDLLTALHLSNSSLTVAARGVGHSVGGQAQASGGIVIDMSSLRGIQVHSSGSYVEARGGDLWVDVVRESLKKGLSPRSLTDYLHLTVGGTLSNAGVSGQAFRFGPQISNVLELEVVTGKGDVVRCSPDDQPDLFFGVLGGLGQFGIITRAKIHLQPAPSKVKWIRALYSDFDVFTRDQEMLISRPEQQGFDYVEGSVIVNSNHPGNEYKPIPFHGQILNTSLIPKSAGPVIYCLELTKNYNDDQEHTIDKVVSSLLSELGHIPSLVFQKDASYFEFLNRVHDGEIRLRKKGLWDVPHPWMNLLIPKSKIHEFDARIFRKVLQKGINGPLLVYPLDKSKWDSRTSVVTPDEQTFYLVGMLRYASLTSTGASLVEQNKEILRLCSGFGIKLKQYMPQHSGVTEWKKHYGASWSRFMQRKLAYDPHAVLSPGQNILPRSAPERLMISSF